MHRFFPRAAGVALLLAVATACGGGHDVAAPGTTHSSAPSGSVASTSGPATGGPGNTTSVPPSGGAPSGAPTVGTMTVSGTVEAGVEAGCMVVKTAGAQPTVYTLVGNKGTLRVGQNVTLVGQITQGMSICQQGSLFEVAKVLKAS